MTTTDYRSAEAVDPAAERSLRARRAVAAFRRMQPMLNNYARAFTGNPRITVELHASSNGATDGKKIFYRPPIALGDEHKHAKKLCDKRDEDTLAQLCRACELREQVLTVMFHEIAHISFGTFVKPTQQAQADLLRRAVEASGTKYAAAITERIQRMHSSVKHSYLAMAGQVSPFLPIILNAVEDARVNNALFDARRGTRLMFEADIQRTFNLGVETLDADGSPRYTPWSEREQNMQLIVGLYCAVSEYDYSNWFIPPVIAALEDSIIQELCTQARLTKNVDDNYQISFKFLDRFRQLGFCKSATDPEDEEPEPEAEPEPDNEDTDGDEDEDGPPEADSDSDDSDSGGDAPDDEADSEDPAAAQPSPAGDQPSEEDLLDGGTEEGETPSEDGQGEAEQSDSDEAPAPGDESDSEADDESKTEGSGSPSDQPGEDEAEDQFGESDSGTAEQEGQEADEDSDGGSPGEGSDGEESEQGASDSDEGAAEEAEGEVGDDESGGEQGTGEIGRQDNESGTPEAEADNSGEDGRGAAPAVAGEEDGSPSDDPGADDEGMGDGSDSPESEEPAQGVDDADEEAAADADPGTGADGSADDGDESASYCDDFGDGELADDLGDGEANKYEYDPTSDNEVALDDEAETKIEVPEEPEERPAGEDDEAIDTGADEGMGGIEVEEVEADYSSVPMGDAAEVQEGLEQFGHHEDEPETPEEQLENEALLTAILQGQYFETPSQNITGVRIHEYGTNVTNEMDENLSTGWGGLYFRKNNYSRKELGIDGDFLPEESILGRQLLKLRVVFADNQRAHQQHHLKSGRVNTRVLGRRAPLGDERLFQKKTVPGKKSYFVAIALDISGSTVGKNLQLIKAAAWAQADLLTRLGIPFCMYGCSGSYDSLENARTMYLDIYPVKHENEPWNRETQKRMLELGPDFGNLDGHNLEFMRKLCDKSQATDKIIMYYSDGKMPATNHDEELEILVRELALCKKKGYIVAGVGVRTDSPSRHGMPTVQINEKNDVGLVVKHLENMLRAKLRA